MARGSARVLELGCRPLIGARRLSLPPGADERNVGAEAQVIDQRSGASILVTRVTELPKPDGGL